MKTNLFFFKTLLLMLLIWNLTSCDSKKSDNPLLDSAWSGIAKIPQEAEIVLKFSKDKIDVLLGNKVIETMNYTLSNGEIDLVKNSGGTPCDAGTKGKYKYEIIGENLVMTLISDECNARIKSLQGIVYKKTDIKK
ncbi:hypothetical protein [Chryseobacterium scophthalmum]|uniref:Lipocalin-like domain-containing protein n=1 Tax=Chryseobacterium scophthalmum TaxID=59733 RepID=A0A1N6IDK5_9FLAO|nr:hypothetical protein [Chryseobacterium scophthalmum]SIO30126.1 hypothetical protein SAMN05421769_3342 [Chryseobacterium scophthalmum]